MIYTGNYFKLSKFRGIKVQISNSKPNSIQVDYVFKDLIPAWSLVDSFKKGKITEEEFELSYLKQLNKLDKEKVYHKLFQLNDDVILLCWCRGFCHRHILAKWLNKGVIEW